MEVVLHLVTGSAAQINLHGDYAFAQDLNKDALLNLCRICPVIGHVIARTEANASWKTETL